MSVSGRMKRTSNSVGIIIDKDAEGFKGQVINRFGKETAEFEDLPGLFDLIEEVLDEVNYPAVKIQKRHFKHTEDATKKFKVDQDLEKIDVTELLPGNEGYILMVTGRDNATIQGALYIAAEDKEYKFNGDVELVRLLNK